ncbi:MAG: hypothetical protein ABWX62_04080 [Microterricola sp.]
MNYDDAGFVLAFSALIPVLGLGLGLLAGLRRPQLPVVVIASAALLALWLLFGARAVLGADASLSLSIYYGLLFALTAVQLSPILPREPRARTGGWVAFVIVWALLAQLAIAAWTLNLVDGWLVASLGLLDFGGSSMLFIATASAGLACLLAQRSRGPIIAVATPRRAVATIIPLWLGFFALTVGSEAVPDEIAVDAAVNTVLAPLGAVVAWVVVERIRHHRVSIGGAVRGIFAGLVAVTPAADVLSPFWACMLGLASGAVAAALAGPRGSVLGLLLTQLTAAALGCVFIGILGDGVGGLITGSWAQLGTQLFSIAVVAGFAFIVAGLVALTVGRVMVSAGRSRERPETVG